MTKNTIRTFVWLLSIWPALTWVQQPPPLPRLVTGLVPQIVFPKQPPALCPTVVTALAPQLIFDVPTEKLRRVELRTCAAGGDIQIVAWQDKASEATLVLDSERTTVVQLVMSKNVFFLQTAGGTAHRIQVIVYEDGVPRIGFDRFTKNEPAIRLTAQYLYMDLADAKGRIQRFTFPTGRQ